MTNAPPEAGRSGDELDGTSTPSVPARYRDKPCAECGEEFTPTSGRSQLCDRCRALPEVRRQRQADAARAYRDRKTQSVNDVAAVTDSPQMSKGDREQLLRMVRQRAKIAKDDVTVRKAQVIADAEVALAREFERQDEAWAELVAEAQVITAEVNVKVQAICAQKGIPRKFRPSLNTYWLSRGVNAEPARRAELRKVVRTAAEAAERTARLEVDRWSADLQTQVMAGGMSAEARELLDRLPTAEALMPPLNLPELDG